MLQQSLKAKLSQKMEEGAVGVKGEEYTAVFLGHTLTPPLVEATIMASVFKTNKVFQSQVFQTNEYLKRRVLFSTPVFSPLINSPGQECLFGMGSL